jgi:hypothetical protein
MGTVLYRKLSPNTTAEVAEKKVKENIGKQELTLGEMFNKV